MHMADALLSPTVGVTLWAASAATLAWCSKHIRKDSRAHLVPLMGVLGAFVFAAQMINFAIPGTGSSGHIGGGLLLAILLGGPAAFVVITSVLTVQALFFADGGLLALGANIFNLGVIPCLIAYPLIYRPLLKAMGAEPSNTRRTIAIMLATVIGLQLGALGVVVQTQLSDISSLPLGTFLMMMQPIHLAIGIVEGLATAAVIRFIHRARPDLIEPRHVTVGFPGRIIAVFAALAIATGGALSWFASSDPDGLEWSIARVSGAPEIAGDTTALHQALGQLQAQVAPMPDYALPAQATAEPEPAAWPAVDAGTSLAGILGGLATLLLVSGFAWLLRPRRKMAKAA